MAIAVDILKSQVTLMDGGIIYNDVHELMYTKLGGFMQDRAVDVVNMAGSVAAGDMSVFGLIAQADVVVKTVMLLLLASSFWCWAIIFNKWSSFRDKRFMTSKFEKAYRSSRVLGALYDRISKKSSGGPMADMFVASMYEFRGNQAAGRAKRSEDSIKEQIYSTAQRVKHNCLDSMESNLIFLATVGSAAPFIGLFGTVWGIVNSFQAIAATKNTSLAVVAPGIAEALLATAMGLFAAIPAVIFYNLFSNDIRKFSGKLEDYAHELSISIPFKADDK